MREFDWRPFRADRPKTSLVSKISKAFGIGRVAAEVLVRRGFSTSKTIHKYLHGGCKDLYDPFLFTDMNKAVGRLLLAKDRHESVFIHGDYDCDGVVGAALVKMLCDELELAAEAFVPSRALGYGLSREAVQGAIKAHHRLIITVDCGSNEHEALKLAKDAGIDVIVLDHHHFDQRPDVEVLINPNETCYPFSELCGAGVAFKLMQAVATQRKFCPEDYLDLVAVATVADAVPLVDENRILVKEGLERIKTSTNLGMHYLIKVSSLLHRKVNTEAVGFILAPKINAAGRIANPKIALDLLLTCDSKEADRLAHELARINKERMAINAQIRDEAIDMIEKYHKDDPFIVLSADGWHKGVIGIVSSTVVEIYHKPCAVIAQEYGSVRTVPEFPLLEPLRDCSDLFVRWGGHPMAAGLTIEKGNIGAFREKINSVARKMGLPSNPMPRMTYDKKLKLREVSMELVEDLEKLEPFGQGNELPCFVVEDMNVARDRVTKDGQHLQLSIRQGNSLSSAVGFWMAHFSEMITDPTQKFDILFFLERSRYNTEQMMVKDLKEVKLDW